MCIAKRVEADVTDKLKTRFPCGGLLSPPTCHFAGFCFQGGRGTDITIVKNASSGSEYREALSAFSKALCIPKGLNAAMIFETAYFATIPIASAYRVTEISVKMNVVKEHTIGIFSQLGSL